MSSSWFRVQFRVSGATIKLVAAQSRLDLIENSLARCRMIYDISYIIYIIYIIYHILYDISAHSRPDPLRIAWLDVI